MGEEINFRNSSTEVDALLEKKDKVGALTAFLRNSITIAKHDELKEANFLLLEKLISQFSESEVNPAVNILDTVSCDLLMKYIYKLMQHNNGNNAVLLKFHAELYAKAGVGSIVRVLTDRKTV